MKGTRVYSLYRRFFQGNLSQVIFITPSFRNPRNI